MKAVVLWNLIALLARMTRADTLIVRHPTESYIGFGGLLGTGLIYGIYKAGTASFTVPFQITGVVRAFKVTIIVASSFLVLLAILMWSR